MNFNKTVFNRTRMSPNITSDHRLSKATASATTTTSKTTISRPVLFESKRTSILMESNVNIKTLIKSNNERHSLSVHDERLIKILTSQIDEPLYINDEQNNQRFDNNDNNTLHCTATSSIVNGVTADDYENLPPTTDFVVTNTEDMEIIAMTCTPPRHPFINQIKRDLNSPSASVRLRALRALKSPTGGSYYNFDVPHEEQEIVSDAERNAPPKTIQEVMKNIIVYVEVRTANDNRTAGVKKVISDLGAKVNDKLLRNTTHVIFKDGLQSTYNKAKNWNIPIVSILWVEACKKHLVIMDPKAFRISNADQYENPELYEKMKRHKSMQPGAEEKILNRKIPKSKILELTTTATAPKHATPSTALSKLAISTPNNVSIKSTKLFSSATKGSSEKPKTINNGSISKRLSHSNLEQKQKNTIRSMFIKQIEKSQNTSNVGPNANEASINETSRPILVNLTDAEKSHLELDGSKSNTGEILVPGNMHRRLTRRNSMTIHQLDESNDFVIAETTPINNKSRRRTMFTPATNQTTIREEDDANNVSNELVNDNKTIHKTALMEESLDRTGETMCNNLISEPKTPSRTANKLPDGLNRQRSNSAKKATTTLKSVLRRRTLYTPLPMEETNVQESSNLTPNMRRKTLNFNLDATHELLDTSSCDAICPSNEQSIISTPNDFSKSMPKLDSSLFSTPFIKSMSQMHIDLIRTTTSKTLLDEYSNTFSSKKVPVNGKRRTISHISMDIINQRVENINKNASLHRSISDINDKHNATSEILEIPTLPESPCKLPDTPTDSKPMKRKLFAPPSMFSPIPIATPKTAAKTTIKRGRDDAPANPKAQIQLNDKRSRKTLNIEQNNKQNDDDVGNGGTVKKTATKSRRSTMLFQSARKIKPDESNETTAESATIKPNVVTESPKSVMVFTNMHQTQIDLIKEAVAALGKFEIEENVNKRTTHLISLEPRRTVNLLRGLIRGLWILDYDWILKSIEANEWQPEELFELRTFSKAVEICRMERQAFGVHYRMDIFADIGTIYVSSKCKCNALTELIRLCHGKLTNKRNQAKYIIDEWPHIEFIDKCLSPNWILDSITIGKLKKIQPYILKCNANHS